MDLLERDESLYDGVFALALHALRSAAAAGDVAHDVACEFGRNGDDQVVDGLENDRVSAFDGIFESHLGRLLECDFLTVDRVLFTVVERYFAVDEFAARKNAFCQDLADSLLDCGYESVGDYAADDRVNEFEFAVRIRLEDDVDLCELA